LIDKNISDNSIYKLSEANSSIKNTKIENIDYYLTKSQDENAFIDLNLKTHAIDDKPTLFTN